MSKKMLKRSLALGALMAFVITGQAWAAENITTSGTIDSNISVSNGNWISSSNTYTAVNVSNDVDVSVIGNINVDNTKTDNDSGTRIFGVAVQNGSAMDISGTTNINITGGAGADVRALRVNSYPDETSLTVNNLNITAIGNSPTSSNRYVIAAIDNWQKGELTVNGNANIKAVQTAGGTQYAIAVHGGGKATFNGSTTALIAESKNGGGAQGIAFADSNCELAEVIFNSDVTTIDATSNYSAIGIGGEYEGKATFNKGNVTINVTNTSTDKSVDAKGIMSNLVVSSDVNNFTLNVSGSGVIADDSAFSDGTVALYAVNDQMDIDAKNLNINVTASSSENITGDTASGTATRSATNGIVATNGGKIDITSNTTIAVTDPIGNAYGVYGEDSSDIDLADTTITVTSDGGEAYGVFALNDATTVDIAGDLTVTATGAGNTAGVYARYGADVNMNNEEANVNITANSSKDWAFGVRAYSHTTNGNDSSVNIVADEVNITANATEDAYAWAVYSSSDVDTGVGQSSIEIDANKTIITADAEQEGNASAIVTFSGSKTVIKGDLEATGDNAIYTRGNATTLINSDEEGNVVDNEATVVLTGNIAYGDGSSSDLDATVNVNLVGNESKFNGAIVTLDENDVIDSTFAKEEVTTGTALGLYNGATWNVTKDSFVNTMNGTDGNVVLTTESATDDGVDVAQVDIGTNNNENLTVSGDEALTKAIENGVVDADTALNVLNNAVTTGEGEDKQSVANTVKTAEGNVLGSYVLTENGAELQENSKSAAVSEAGMNLKAHWRAHMNDMNKRMGELRFANGEAGVWTRMVRGESEYEGAKMQYNQYQLGYDEKLSVDKRWTVGAAVTFSEGDSSYATGSSDDKSTAFAIYGSKLNNDGTFVDLIARYARLESDIEDRNYEKGEYDTNGMSVSAEFGKRIQQGNGLWIEPQVELTYGTVDSASVRFADGSVANYGDMDSFIGRVGFSLGKDIKQGNVYARASYLYDFDGETETTFSNGTVSGKPVEEDFGGGWWEVGVGANINLSKATYIYADIEKTFGGEVDTNWQWNLGVRYSF